MKRIVFSILLTAAAFLPTGCKSTHSGATDGNISQHIGRIPTQEVDEETLRTESLLIEAKMQLEADNTHRAREIYTNILQQHPDCAAAHYEMAVILADEYNLDAALQHALAAHALNGKNVWYDLLLVEIYETRHETAKVAESWEAIVGLQPDKVENYHQLSNAYLADGNGEKAIDALNRIERRWGITEEVSLQKQRIWDALGHPDKGLREIEKLAKSMPNSESYNAMVAEAYMRQQEYRRAKPYYDNILRQHPDDAYIHISLANYHKLTGNMDSAIAELKSGLLHPALSCRDRIQILTTFFTPEAFYSTYSADTYPLADSVVLHCDDSMSYALFYADLLMRRDRYGEAIPWIRFHLSHDSSSYEPWEALLICESMIDTNQQLIVRDAGRTANLFPFHTLPRYLLALAAHEQKQYADALKHLEYCRKTGFRNGYLEFECYALMAECYYRTQQKEQAWQYFDHCLKIKADDVGILNNYAYYLCIEPGIEKTQLMRAEQMSRRTIEAEPDNATFLDTYAWILHQMGRDREALSYMQRAIEHDNQNSETLQQHYQSILSNQ